MPVVLAPLPNIPVQVAKSKGVGSFKLVYRGRLLAVYASCASTINSIFLVSAVVISVVGVKGCAEVKGRGRSGSTGIFPFGFGREAVLAIGMDGEPIAKLYCALPGHRLNRVAIALKLRRIGFQRLLYLGHGRHHTPLCLGYRVLCQKEPGEGDGVLGRFAIEPP